MSVCATDDELHSNPDLLNGGLLCPEYITMRHGYTVDDHDTGARFVCKFRYRYGDERRRRRLDGLIGALLGCVYRCVSTCIAAMRAQIVQAAARAPVLSEPVSFLDGVGRLYPFVSPVPKYVLRLFLFHPSNDNTYIHYVSLCSYVHEQSDIFRVCIPISAQLKI